MDASQFSYRQFPAIEIEGFPGAVSTGAGAVREQAAALCRGREKTVITAECYPGADQEELRSLLEPLGLAEVIHSDELALPPEEIDGAIARDLTEDPVFGVLTTRRLEEFFPKANLDSARRRIGSVSRGIVLVYGVGASLVCRGDVLLLADVTRWELQLRFRRGMDNWRTARRGLSQREKYKRGYFAEWRWADRVKDRLLPEMDLYLDMTAEGTPAAVSGGAYRAALEQAAGKPFRMVPYFDPGVWGGDWMKTHFDLPENGGNYAWSFDGVPEENSLLLDFGGGTVRTPAVNLVLSQPRRLLGERVHGRYGKEFPIRFDMLDTIHGQNLSLQVHPLTEYIQDRFNMRYTQDESYYILDTEGEDPCVYLGVKTGADPREMRAALEEAQTGGRPFPAEDFVNRLPVKKHDHVLIPAGTVHCSGANTMVLEISATPYIFTFKMWDWGRLDLDGKPRPIHLDHGLANVQWDRDTRWVRENLVHQAAEVYRGECGLVERTGLHEREPLDTFRVSTAGEIPIARNGSVHMLNLVEGRRVLLAGGEGAFPPFELRYAETCVVPEAAGDYRIVSPDGEPVLVIIACVRK